MEYAIIILLTLPAVMMFSFTLLIATGVFHEPAEIKQVARNYAQSWQSAESQGR